MAPIFDDSDDEHGPRPEDGGYGISPSNARGDVNFFQQTIDIGNGQSFIHYFSPLPRTIRGALRDLSTHRAVGDVAHIPVYPLRENNPQIHLLRDFVRSPFRQSREMMLVDRGDAQHENGHFTDSRSYVIRTNDGHLHVHGANYENWYRLPQRRIHLNYINFIVRMNMHSYRTERDLFQDIRVFALDRPGLSHGVLTNRVLESILTVRAAIPSTIQDTRDIIYLYAFTGDDFWDMTDANLESTIDDLNNLPYSNGRRVNSNIFSIVRVGR